MEHQQGFLKLVDAARSRIRECTVDDVMDRQERGEAFHLIDVREESEWNAGHIRGATHLGKGIIERDIETTVPDRDAEIILYCGGGFRSALAADALRQMGYTNVASMDGGWRSWSRNGYPTER